MSIEIKRVGSVIIATHKPDGGEEESLPSCQVQGFVSNVPIKEIQIEERGISFDPQNDRMTFQATLILQNGARHEVSKGYTHYGPGYFGLKTNPPVFDEVSEQLFLGIVNNNPALLKQLEETIQRDSMIV